MPDPADKTCPECGHVTTGPQAALLMGQHRRRAHNIVGTSATTAKRRRAKDRAPKAGPAKARAPSLASDLKRTFKVIGTLVAAVDPYCGSVLINRSAAFSDALARLAAEDERIGRALRVFGKAGPYGALFVAGAEFAVPIAAHHGLLNPELVVLVGAPIPPGRGKGDGEGVDEASGLAMPLPVTTTDASAEAEAEHGAFAIEG